MKDHPILMSSVNVKAILDGRKSQTRRIIKPQPKYRAYLQEDAFHIPKFGYISASNTSALLEHLKCPYGVVGDRLYVKESYQIEQYTFRRNCVGGKYLADNKEFWTEVYQREYDLIKNRKFPLRATSGRFMYKSLARFWLEITNIRVEMVRDMYEQDAEAEGVIIRNIGETYRRAFRNLWDSLNAKRGLCKTCRGSQKVVGWAGSLEANSLMQTAEDCPDCDGETGYGWDKNPYVWVIDFKRIEANK